MWRYIFFNRPCTQENNKKLQQEGSANSETVKNVGNQQNTADTNQQATAKVQRPQASGPAQQQQQQQQKQQPPPHHEGRENPRQSQSGGQPQEDETVGRKQEKGEAESATEGRHVPRS